MNLNGSELDCHLVIYINLVAFSYMVFNYKYMYVVFIKLKLVKSIVFVVVTSTSTFMKKEQIMIAEDAI